MIESSFDQLSIKFYDLIISENVSAVQDLLSKNPELVNKKLPFDGLPIHVAVRSYSLQVLKLLIKFGADINSIGMFKERPLHVACREGFIDIVKLLVESGAEINCLDQLNNTPLHFACIDQQEEIALYLISKRSEINKKNSLNFTPVFQAAASGSFEIIKSIYDSNKHFDVVSEDGNTLYI